VVFVRMGELGGARRAWRALQRLGSRACRRALKYVFIFVWNTITFYLGIVRPGTAGMEQYISRMQFPNISPVVGSLPASVQARRPRELLPTSARVCGGRSSEVALSEATAQASASVCASP
jgi:hypothetical protein